MTKMDKYKAIFCKVFNVKEDDLDENFTFKNIDIWTSLAHLSLISELEDAFDVMFDPEDILHYGSFENGRLILEKYGVDLNSEVE